MVVKPSIQWLNTDSDPELINDTNVVIRAMTDNVDIYKNPSPTLAQVQTDLDNFSGSLAASLIGGRPDTARKNNLRLVLVNDMRLLAHYVAVACGGDMNKLLLSGFPPQKPTRDPIGPLPVPVNLILKHGAASGILIARANPVFGAATYNWKLTPSTPGAAVITQQTTAAHTTFEGLTPGVTYTAQVNAAGSSGTSGWSNPATLVAD